MTIPLAYGDHPDQVIDLSLPDRAGGVPLVVLLHGGFWRPTYDRHHLEPVAADLVGRGYAVANVEYRREGAAGWPSTLADVARATDTLTGLVEDAAPGVVDPDRIVLVGHSAGGHLALWTTLRDRLPAGAPGAAATQPKVAGVVALAPVCDLADGYARGIGSGAVAEFVGGGPADVPERYAAADPATLGTLPVPAVIVHGDRDDRVPVEMSRRYAKLADAELVELPGVGHFELIAPADDAWPVVVGAIDTVVTP